MSPSRLVTLIVGLFVLAGVAGVVVAAALLTGRTGRVDTYTTTYDAVSGIKYGTQVQFEGYRIGQVEEITPDQSGANTTFRLTLSVEEGWKIPEGSEARISATGLLSGVIIDITGGPGPGLLEPGSEIPSGESGGMFAALNSMAAEVGDLSREGLRPLVAKLNTSVDILGDAMAEDVPAILANLRVTSQAASDRLPALLDRAEAITRRVDEEILSQNTVENVSQSVANLAAFTAELSDLGAGLNDSRAELDRTIRTVGRMVRTADPAVQASLKDLRYTLRSLASSVDTITFNLEGASRDMKEFSRSIRQNPGLLLRGGAPADAGQ